MARCRVRGAMRCAGLLVVLLAVPVCGWPSQDAPVAQQSTPAAAELQPGSAPAASSATAGGTIEGVIKSGQTPLPGVSVTAKNTLTGKQYVTATDARGGFKLHIDEDGRYVVRAEFAGFAARYQRGGVPCRAPRGRNDFSLILDSRQQQIEQAEARRAKFRAYAAGQRPAAIHGRPGRAEYGLMAGALGAIAAARRRRGACLRRQITTT